MKRIAALRRYALFAGLLVAGVLALRTSVLGVVYVQSASMLPTFFEGDGIFTDQLAYGLNLPFSDELAARWGTPERGELLIFRNPFDRDHLWLKRVVGLPGDTLEFRDHRLYLNGRDCRAGERGDESLTPDERHHIWPSYLETDWGPVTVPADHLFVMGDNRGNSEDSRSWGVVPLEAIRGRPLLRFWPPERFGAP